MMSSFDQFLDKIIASQSLSDVTYTTGADGKPLRIAYITPGGIPNPFKEGPGLPATYSIENAPGGQVKFYTNIDKIDPTEPTFVYAHGWTDNAIPDGSSIKTNKLWNAYTTVYGEGVDATANIIFVDWSTLARKQGGYTKEPTWEATVTKQVGEVIAQAIELSGVDLSKTTLVGHSLGSFVVGAAANELAKVQKVGTLVALDTAATNPLFPEYDIDARNGIQRNSNPFDTTPNNDKPYDFTLNLANDTFSYTVIDYGFLDGSLASNESRAATANHAYLVNYTPMDFSLSQIGYAASNYHNGVVTAYADLILKSQGNNYSVFNPSDEISSLKFDVNGNVNQAGKFDGILVASQPWISDPATFAPVGSIGWADSVNLPNIYGTAANDVMFYDRFNQNTSQAANLYGSTGDDLIGANTLVGIDRFTGGLGVDTFYFGYEKNGAVIVPFLDGSANGGEGTFAVIEDFSYANEDKILFSSQQNTVATQYTDSFAAFGSGMKFSVNGDLVAFVRGMTADLYNASASASLIVYGSSPVNLDTLLLTGNYPQTSLNQPASQSSSLQIADSQNSSAAVSSQNSLMSNLPLYNTPQSQTGYIEPTRYTGAVSFLEWQLIGGDAGDVVIGAKTNDFISLGVGDDAANGGAGRDVLDGGVGSSFLTGGTEADTFFVDGRNAVATWSTITDFSEAQGDTINMWGWRVGVSHLITSLNDGGATGYTGATYHYDLDGNRAIDTSITFVGLTTSQVGNPTTQSVAGNGYLLWA